MDGFKPLGSGNTFEEISIPHELINARNTVAEQLLGFKWHSEFARGLDGGPFCFPASLAASIHMMGNGNYTTIQTKDWLVHSDAVITDDGFAASYENLNNTNNMLRHVNLELEQSHADNGADKEIASMIYHIRRSLPVILLEGNTWKTYFAVNGGNADNDYQVTFNVMSPTDSTVVARSEKDIHRWLTNVPGGYWPSVLYLERLKPNGFMPLGRPES